MRLCETVLPIIDDLLRSGMGLPKPGVARVYNREAILRKNQGRRSQVLISRLLGMWPGDAQSEPSVPVVMSSGYFRASNETSPNAISTPPTIRKLAVGTVANDPKR